MFCRANQLNKCVLVPLISVISHAKKHRCSQLKELKHKKLIATQAFINLQCMIVTFDCCVCLLRQIVASISLIVLHCEKHAVNIIPLYSFKTSIFFYFIQLLDVFAVYSIPCKGWQRKANVKSNAPLY